MAISESEDPTLQLRLRATLAKINGTEVELGKELINELSDLEKAPPPVLATICEASFAMQDYSRAEELLKIFQVHFEESDYMRAAFKLRAYGQYEQKDYEGALQTIEEAQETYGTIYDLAWSQLMKAQILLALERFDDARLANEGVLAVSAWRGEPVAQATYQLGQVWEAAGNLRMAHAMYQRAYMQYRGYSFGHWAAEGFLGAARCLDKLGMEQKRRNTYRAMLFDNIVNKLPQADVARKALGTREVAEIELYIETGGTTNIVVQVESDNDAEIKDQSSAGGDA
jgi:tetratricopeptide (TPR) repeat protein